MDVSRTRCAGCGQPMAITRLECSHCGVSMQGEFETSPLARLSAEDQRFVHAFLRHHGSIKKMEALLGVSYPTVKNRLSSITAELDQSFDPVASNASVLERLAKGEISVQQALEALS